MLMNSNECPDKKIRYSMSPDYIHEGHVLLGCSSSNNFIIQELSLFPIVYQAFTAGLSTLLTKPVPLSFGANGAAKAYLCQPAS